MGFPGGASGQEPACQSKRHKRHGFNPWVRKIPWRRAWQPILVFFPGESHGQRSLAGYSPWGRKELDTTEATQHASTHTKRGMGSPGGSAIKNPPATQEMWFTHWVGKILVLPLEKKTATHSSILDWEIPWTEKPGRYSPWSHKSQTRLSN